MTELSTSQVEAIFMDCLFKEEECPPKEYIAAEGIINNVGFHPQRLESHRQEVIDMLAELPDDFKQDGGGGWSFLNACMDKKGNQWTSFHQTMEQLFQLGLGLKLVRSLMPREMWNTLPGGMPYYLVLVSKAVNP